MSQRDERSCGECRACCTGLGVVELKKPPGTACRHECAQGCAIYAQRPRPCREFHCLWRLGFGEETARPDRVGFFLIHLNDYQAQFGVELMEALEAYPGAFDRVEVRTRLGRLARSVGLVLLRDAVPIDAMGPPAAMAKLRLVLRERASR